MLAIFLVLFPKGGFKLGSVPITWGYTIVGITMFVGVVPLLVRNSLKVGRGTVGAFFSLLPFQILLLYSLAVNGVEDFGFALSDVVAFFILPIAFLVIYPQFLLKIRMVRLIALIRWLVFLAAAYGIFLWVWRMVTGSYIEIPFLTVNVDDLGTLGDKYNSRPDGFFKLISTYNNGNQYGVATLLLLPIIDEYETSRFRRLVIRAALMLTLSRTIWVGLVIYEAVQIFRLITRDLIASQQLAIKYSTLKRSSRLVILSAVVLGMTLLFSGISFLFDSSLGGRTEYLQGVTEHLTLLPEAPVAQFTDVIYFTALTMFGISGLVALSFLFCSPLVLTIKFRELHENRLQLTAFLGLVIYIPLAAMDGALNYIPTMAFYWFLWMVFIHGRHVAPESLQIRTKIPARQRLFRSMSFRRAL